jgi:chemotaxis protein methyltransferase CheR
MEQSRISGIHLDKLSQLIISRMGLSFPQSRWLDLERGIQSAVGDLGFKTSESCVEFLISAPWSRKEIEILAAHLTVGETYFFRDRRVFECLEGYLTGLLQSRAQNHERRIRIWSAGCCTGEEPYSIAMVLDRLIPDSRDWAITILATDISPRVLEKAARGVYHDWSFRETPPWIKEKYFKKLHNGRYEISSRIKEMVTFSYLNLAEDGYPSLVTNTNAMDLILCRNVLMYFTGERAKKVIEKFCRALIDTGRLVINATESTFVLPRYFSPVEYSDLAIYKKGATKSLFKTPDRNPPFSSPTPQTPLIPLPAKPRGAEQRREIPVLKEQNLTHDLYQEGMAFYRQGSYDLAAERIHANVLVHCDDTKSMILLARIYANQGRLSDALAWCQKAAQADKLNPDVHYLMAIILEEGGQIDGASMSLKRAIYLDPNFVLAHFGLGNLANLQKRYGEAEKHFENAMELLNRYSPTEVLSESEGITAGRLKEIVQSMIYLGSRG